MARFPEHIGSNEVRPVTVAEQIHRVTVDEYLRIVRDLGWESTELVEGVVYDVSPTYGLHTRTVMHVFRRLDAHLEQNVTFNVGSVQLGSRTLVDPDVYVVADTAVVTDPALTPGSGVILAVEVSVTTQAHDRGARLIAYAKAGVPEVWLIDPRPDAGWLLRHREPDGASYRSVERFDVGEDAADLDAAAVLRR